MTERAQTTAAPGPPAAPAADAFRQGEAPPAATPAPTAGARVRMGWRRWLMVGLAVVALAVGGVFGYRWWYTSVHFVSTSNAQIAGRPVQVGSLVAGRVAGVRYDVGDRVGRDAVVATLHVAVPVGATGSGTPRLEYRETSDSLIEVRAPTGGVVIARNANPHDIVPAGQPLLTIVDPGQLWVTANIEETQIRRVRLGQPVLVHVDALDLDLSGRVVAITPASAGTFSLLPNQNMSGNFTRVTQLVPVRIALDEPDERLMIGTSASVTIQVAD